MRALRLAALPALALAAVVWLGPQPSPDASVRPPALPAIDSLDAHFQAQEAAFDDLVPGTEKTIRWAGDAGTPTRLSVVYLHGFSASRQETAPLADTIAARLGANLFYTRLSGHGRAGDAMGEATATDWLRDAREALAVGRRLGERVILIGTSTGGTLATWVAAQRDTAAGDVEAVVLLSPNFGLKAPSGVILGWPWGRQLAEFVVGTHRDWEPHNDAQARYFTERYPTRALVQMMALVELVDASDLSGVSVPVLAVHDPNDQVVDPAATPPILARMAGPTTYRTLDSDAPANHVIAGDILSPRTTLPLAEDVVTFLREGQNR